MKNLLEVLDKYFPSNGITEQEKYHTAYGMMSDFLRDMQSLTGSEGFEPDVDFDFWLDEAMAEKFGYTYTVNDMKFNSAEEVAEKILTLGEGKMSHEEILIRVDNLACMAFNRPVLPFDDDEEVIDGVKVSVQRNW